MTNGEKRPCIDLFWWYTLNAFHAYLKTNALTVNRAPAVVTK